MVLLFLSQDTNKELSLGPIKDLEGHVKSNWREHLFNDSYLKTDRDVVEDEAITKSKVALFTNILNPA